MKKLIATLALLLTLGSTVVTAEEYIPSYQFTDQEIALATQEVPWTAWNTTLFATAIGGQVLDVVSTEDALDRGCIEGNPLFGEGPNVAVMVGAKAAMLGLSYYLIEHLVTFDSVEDQQDARNWAYGFQSILGFGISTSNYSTDCKH